jgi:surface polysaccharide O-acyltransferase-like enzyme
VGEFEDRGKALSQESRLNIPVDLIRTLAIVGVVLLHATNDFSPDIMNPWFVARWLTVDVYQCIGRIGVPLFVMLSGALLLQPSKNERLSTFFKKRWVRVGIPFLFWGAIYFVWIYFTQPDKVVNANFIFQGYLSPQGNTPYLQFWYVYMLAGLYLLTPILRVIIAHASDRTIWYFMVLWFAGAAILPTITFFTNYSLNADVFTITGWVGYYILGLYLLKPRIPRLLIGAFMVMGISLSAIGTVYVSWTYGGGTSYFFQEYFSPTLILAAVMAYMLLNTVKMPSYRANQCQSAPNAVASADVDIAKPSIPQRLLHVISENTFAIFMLHLIVLETLQKGFLWGLTITGVQINSIVGVPLMTALVILICLAIIVPLKKVPYLKTLIG